MGITQIVSGVADMIQRWGKVRMYWPHLIMIAIIFIVHIQEWWVTYEMRVNTYWRLPTFLFVILYPVNLYILTRILFPISWRGKFVDLKDFYYGNYKRIYFFTVTLDVLGIIDNVFIGGYRIQDQVVQIAVLLMLSFIIIRGNSSEIMHKSVATVFMVITVVTLIITWNEFIIVGQ